MIMGNEWSLSGSWKRLCQVYKYRVFLSLSLCLTSRHLYAYTDYWNFSCSIPWIAWLHQFSTVFLLSSPVHPTKHRNTSSYGNQHDETKYATEDWDCNRGISKYASLWVWVCRDGCWCCSIGYHCRIEQIFTGNDGRRRLDMKHTWQYCWSSGCQYCWSTGYQYCWSSGYQHCTGYHCAGSGICTRSSYSWGNNTSHCNTWGI